MDETLEHMRQDPAFIELVRRRTALSRWLTATILVIYFGFVLLVALAPQVAAMPVAGIISLGFPLGLGVIVSAILLTGLYVLQANAVFDPLTAQIQRDHG